jgi:hypothetical protein
LKRMHKAVGVALSGLVVASSMTMAVAPAQAYDREAAGYAASHFLSVSQLPKEFAAKKAMNISVTTPALKQYVCDYGPLGNKIVWAGKPDLSTNAFYNPKGKGLSLDINVGQYKSNVAAEKAFSQLSKDIKKCDGTFTGSWSDENDNPVPYENVITSGKIPAVTVTGVQSIFTNENSNNAASGDLPAYLNDSMSIFTLVNDVIITTTGSTGSALNFTAKQKKALIQVANDMVTTWVD